MKTYCDFCESELEDKREFIYQLESLSFVDDEELLEAIRRVPAYHGEPLRICERCNNSIQKNLQDLQDDEETSEFHRSISPYLTLLITALLICMLLAMLYQASLPAPR
jgi:hypothetical protein